MFRVLSCTEDKFAWDDLFERLPRHFQDVHFSSAYARIQGQSAILAALIDEHSAPLRFVMQPFLMSPIGSTDYSDLNSLYGYGGPIATDTTLATQFQDQLWNWALNNMVVSEMCCLHPFYEHQQSGLIGDSLLTYKMAKQVVVIDLTKLEMQLHRKVRRGIKKAQEAGAVVERRITPEAAEEFSRLYQINMKRLNGAGLWDRPLEYWQAHTSGVGARFYFLKTSDGQIRRALLTIGTGTKAYAHFFGSDGEERHIGLDELLYFEAAFDLACAGFLKFHLGAGPTSTGVNASSVLSFKAGFSDGRLTAKRYGRIFDATNYDLFCTKRAAEEQERYSRESTAQFFPIYRRPFQ